MVSLINVGKLIVSITTISTVTSTAKNIYKMLVGLKSSYKTNNEDGICDLLEALDIEETLKIVDNTIKEIPNEKLECDAIKTIVRSIEDITKKIEEELLKLQVRNYYNNSLYLLSSLRSYDIKKNYNKIQKFNSILHNRIKLLFELLKIPLTHDSNILNKNKEIAKTLENIEEGINNIELIELKDFREKKELQKNLEKHILLEKEI